MLLAAPPESLNMKELLIGVLPNRPYHRCWPSPPVNRFFLPHFLCLPLPSQFVSQLCSTALLPVDAVSAHVHIICGASDNKGVCTKRLVHGVPGKNDREGDGTAK